MIAARMFRAYFLAVVFCSAAISSAQTYVLTGQIKTVAGSGVQGSAGDGGAATAAKLGASLGATALDSAKNLYIADAGNSVIRKVDTAGNISTVAGTLGNVGYTGDGGAATSATIDGPVGIVFDTAGNMYFSESSNQVIRKVDTSGNISTFKSLGFAPAGIAVNSSNTIFIADPSNNKIWKLDSSQNLSVFAGTGTAGYTGDAGAAASATLSGPVAVATDPYGNVFIADTGNNAIRKVSSGLVITTVAGSGTAGYSGDGSAATSATLDHPRGVAADPLNDIYIADTNNQVIRKVDSAGVIVTLAGTHASTGYTGDGGPGLVAQLSNPAFPLIDVSTVTLYFSDVSNFTVRSLGAATGLNFGNQSVTTTSVALPTELFNASLGTGSISSIKATGDFAVTNAGTCSTTTTLVAGASCTVYVTFTPTATGPRTGTLSIAGGVNGSQNLALAGIGQALPVGTTTALVSSKNPALTTDTLTLTATVTPASGTAVPTGTVDFKNGTTSLGTANVDATGTATLSGVTFNAGGTYSLTASYSGDANFNASTSAALSQVVNAPDFSISLNPTSLSIMRGGSGSATVTITPTDGFTGAVTVTCSGVPANTTCALNPSTINVTSGAATGTLTITTNTQAQLALPEDGTMMASRHNNPRSFPLSMLMGTGVIGIVLAAGSANLRRPSARSRKLFGIFLLALVFACVLLMPSCSGSSGPKSPTGTSTITVTATSGSITHSAQLSVDIHN